MNIIEHIKKNTERVSGTIKTYSESDLNKYAELDLQNLPELYQLIVMGIELPDEDDLCMKSDFYDEDMEPFSEDEYENEFEYMDDLGARSISFDVHPPSFKEHKENFNSIFIGMADKRLEMFLSLESHNDPTIYMIDPFEKEENSEESFYSYHIYEQIKVSEFFERLLKIERI